MREKGKKKFYHNPERFIKPFLTDKKKRKQGKKSKTRNAKEGKKKERKERKRRRKKRCRLIESEKVTMTV